MYKTATELSLILFMLIFATTPALAQAPDIIVVPEGSEQTLSFEHLARASVGSIHIAHIEHVRPNEVVVAATGVGQTSLELTRRDGQTKKFVLRVVPASNSRARTSTKRATHIQSETTPESGTQVTGPAENRSAGSSEITRPSSDAKTDMVPPSTGSGSTSRADAALSAIKNPREDFSVFSRIEISTATDFTYDTERIRLINLNSQEALNGVVLADDLASRRQVETVTVRRYAIVTPVSFGFELSSRNSITVGVPYIRRSDEVIVGGASFKSTGAGLGDVQVSFERRYPRMRKSAWDGSWALNIGLPTGKSIYNVDSDESPLGIGHYEVGGTVATNRVFDPVTFNAAVGLNYYVPKKVEGRSIAPGFGYSMQSGFGYALTDRWVLSEHIEYLRSPNVLLTTPLDAQTVAVDQAILGHSLFYRPRGGHQFHMMFNVGLTPGSSDYGLRFGYSFRSQKSPN